VVADSAAVAVRFEYYYSVAAVAVAAVATLASSTASAGLSCAGPSILDILDYADGE